MLISGGKSNLLKEVLKDEYVAYIFSLSSQRSHCVIIIPILWPKLRETENSSFFNPVGYFYNTTVQAQPFNL